MRKALSACFLVGCFLWPCILLAQTKLPGWGPYRLGKTTPDSLYKTSFHEQPQPLVKGTIVLPCSHIRIFKADTAHLENLILMNLSLAFYDNRLFRIDCDGTATVHQFLNAKYGKATIQLRDTLYLCERNKRMTIEREVWQHEGLSALFVQAEGYTLDCQSITCQKLFIMDQRILALTSECDWKDDYLLPGFKQ